MDVLAECAKAHKKCIHMQTKPIQTEGVYVRATKLAHSTQTKEVSAITKDQYHPLLHGTW